VRHPLWFRGRGSVWGLETSWTPTYTPLAVSAPVVSADHHVSLRYTLFDESSGEPLALDDEEGPTTVEYVHGYGQVLPAIERGLEGASSGTRVIVKAEPADAFGDYEPEGRFELDKAGLDGSEQLELGEEFVASGPDGDLVMRVLEIREDSLIVDTNHPLAGKTIRFEIDVVEVRPATEEELVEAEEALDAEHDACGCGEVHDPHDHDAVVAQPLVQLGGKRDKKLVS
jgi:FKBP-type peptidyl-prolyl cis-trans isomerase SlyD